MAQDTPVKPSEFEALFEQARASYRAEDYETAFQQFLPLARAGYAKAQDYLGYMYRTGQGVEQDFSRAFLWLSRAADQGLRAALTELGVMYDNGEGVPKSYMCSHSLYMDAALEGDARAMLKVGEDYLGGWGTYKDALLALEWYTKARDAGKESAAEKIAEIEALIYEPKVEIPEGMEVEQFIEDLEQRVRDGDPKACFTWALCARDGIGREKQVQFFLEDLVTAIRVKSQEAIEMARNVGSNAFSRYAGAFYNVKMYSKAWYFARLAAAMGNPGGDNVSGMIKLFGHMGGKDEAAAAEYFRKAAEKDHPGACYFYGRIHGTGQGVKKDSDEEWRWLCKSAILGYEDAVKMVMDAIEKGDLRLEPDQMGVYEAAARMGNEHARYELALEYAYSLDESFRDICKAALWFERGVAAGDKDADEQLAKLCSSDEWDERDSLLPPALYGKAAEDGHAFAALHLAQAYLEGVGVEQDNAKAAQLFVKAGNAGSGEGFYRAYCLYRDGDGVRKDLSWATSLLQKSANLKNADAQYALGCAYRDGFGVAQDPLKAIDCFFDAAEQLHTKALGAAAYMEEAFNRPDIAQEHAELAAKLDDPAAKLLIAQKILVGSEYDADPQEARRRFEEIAAEGGELASYANLFLGVIFLKGIGVEEDFSKGLELLMLASEQGCPAAAEIIDDLWVAEREVLREHHEQELLQSIGAKGYVDTSSGETVPCVIPNIEGGWSKFASHLAKEHPDHATYELLLGKVYELGENRYDAEGRRSMLYKYGEDQVMKRKMTEARHGSRYIEPPQGYEVSLYLRSQGLEE